MLGSQVYGLLQGNLPEDVPSNLELPSLLETNFQPLNGPPALLPANDPQTRLRFNETYVLSLFQSK